jgi:hypothetical protein
MTDKQPQQPQQPKKQPINPQQIAGSLEKGARDFATYCLNEVDLVESVAVVFSYSVDTQELPTGVVIGQSGNLQSPTEFVHMLTQLHKTTYAVTQQSHGVVRNLDQLMAIKAQELAGLQKQIDAAKKELKGSAGSSNSPDASEQDGQS